jgi:hypothetical protein
VKHARYGQLKHRITITLSGCLSPPAHSLAPGLRNPIACAYTRCNPLPPRAATSVRLPGQIAQHLCQAKA